MAEGDPRTPRKTWLLCLLLFAATTLNYLDRQTLSILAPTMQKEMHLNNAALGWLFSVFYYTYTLAQFAVGVFLDRSNLRWVFAAAVLAWSVAAGLTSLASGFAAPPTFRLASASPNPRTDRWPCGSWPAPLHPRTGRPATALSPPAPV